MWYMLESDDPRMRMDRCHVTPLELKPFASREPDADFAQIDVDAVARRYKSFATVRHPYIRVLASFDQRTQTGSAHAEDIAGRSAATRARCSPRRATRRRRFASSTGSTRGTSSCSVTKKSTRE